MLGVIFLLVQMGLMSHKSCGICWSNMSTVLRGDAPSRYQQTFAQRGCFKRGQFVYGLGKACAPSNNIVKNPRVWSGYVKGPPLYTHGKVSADWVSKNGGAKPTTLWPLLTWSIAININSYTHMILIWEPISYSIPTDITIHSIPTL